MRPSREQRQISVAKLLKLKRKRDKSLEPSIRPLEVDGKQFHAMYHPEYGYLESEAIR